METKKEGFFAKLKRGLAKTRDNVFAELFGMAPNERIDDEFFDELEEALIIADVGVNTTEKIIERLRDELKQEKIKTKSEARESLKRIIADLMRADDELFNEGEGAVILIVGVNGVGKTTSIGKLAKYYKECGKKPMLAAGDTFRAAAAEQLTVWAERVDVPIVKHGEGADPAAVVFDAIASYKAKGRDMLICDTAGRT